MYRNVLSLPVPIEECINRQSSRNPPVDSVKYIFDLSSVQPLEMSLSFRVIHKVGNVGIFVLLTFENK